MFGQDGTPLGIQPKAQQDEGGGQDEQGQGQTEEDAECFEHERVATFYAERALATSKKAGGAFGSARCVREVC